jgi:hypothetical protein
LKRAVTPVIVKILVTNIQYQKYSLSFTNWLVISLAISITFLWGASLGTLSLSNTLTYPRYSLQKNEAFTWRTQVFYTRQKTRLGDWNLRVGYLTPPAKNGQPLRVYAGYLKTRFGEKTTLKVGRFIEWNPLYLVRVDGLQLTRKVTKNSKLAYLGGSTPQNTPTNNTSKNGTTHYLGWQYQRSRHQLTIATWIKEQQQQQSNLVGFSFRQPLGAKGYTNGFVTWNLTHKRLQRLELLWIREFSERLTMDVQLRYRSFLNSNPFPWSSESLPTYPAFSTKLAWNIHPGLNWSHTFSSRLGKTATDFTYTSTLQWPVVALNFITERHGVTQSLGGLLSASHSITRRLTASGSIFYREYTYNREQHNFISAGFLGWVTFQPTMSLQIRFNTQFFTNRLFTQDGRMGLSVDYVF